MYGRIIAELAWNLHGALEAPPEGRPRTFKGKAVKRLLFCSLLLCLLTACQSSHVLVGAQRAPIDPSQVRVYLQAPAQFEQIAMLEASSAASGAFTRQQKTDKVIARLKAEAAALGANGVLMQGMGNEYAGSVGTGSATFYGNSAFATGFSAPVFNKAGTALAIYVPEGQSQPQASSAQPIAQAQPVPAEPAAAAPQSESQVPQTRQLDPAKRCDSCKQLGRDF